MIKLITDGALPHPAKCASCGYGGNARNYFWFKYKEKWGQVLVCTECFKEAAALPETEFVSNDTYQEILETNFRLQAENDRLELATERFRDGFDSLVASFIVDVAGGPVEREPEEPAAYDVELEYSGPAKSVGVESEYTLEGI